MYDFAEGISARASAGFSPKAKCQAGIGSQGPVLGCLLRSIFVENLRLSLTWLAESLLLNVLRAILSLHGPSVAWRLVSMKNLFKFGAVIALCTVMASGAFAQGKKKMMAKPMACPVCKMPLSMKKTKADPVAIHLNGKTMYCCDGCKMPKSVMGPAKMVHKKSTMKKPMMKKKS